MDKSTVLKIIRRFRVALENAEVGVDRIILFGSWATGTAAEGSDIDLVVISRDFSGKDLWQRNEILVEAIYNVFQPIEAVALTPEEWQRGERMVCHFAKNGEDVT